MLILAQMVFFMAVSAVIGKYSRRITFSTYVLMAFIALVQVGLMLYGVYTMQIPQPPQ